MYVGMYLFRLTLNKTYSTLYLGTSTALFDVMIGRSKNRSTSKYDVELTRAVLRVLKNIY